MADNTIRFGDTRKKELNREAGRDLSHLPVVAKQSDADDFVDRYINYDRGGMFDKVSMSTAQGAAALDAAYYGCGFDGRYVYFTPLNSNTFLRFDTNTPLFSTAASWETMSMSTAQGAAALDLAYAGNAVYDGRYIYYAPFDSNTIVRFDTTQAFTTAAAWATVSGSTALGASFPNSAFKGSIFDGRYIYFPPDDVLTFIRYDTTLSFTADASWERVSSSTILGSSQTNAFNGGTFDGRYIYYGTQNATEFVRFDTQGTSFTTLTDWEIIKVSSVQGAAPSGTNFFEAEFDGRYVYFVPQNADTFIRFDTTQDFTVPASWETMSGSTAIGAALPGNAFSDATFDGRYIHFLSGSSNTLVKFDTQGEFTDTASWTTKSLSEALNATPNVYQGSCYDGKYVYYSPVNADTFLRQLVTPRQGG